MVFDFNMAFRFQTTMKGHLRKRYEKCSFLIQIKYWLPKSTYGKKNICHSRVRMFFNVIIPNILNSQMSFWSFISDYKYIISKISMTIHRTRRETYCVISFAIFSWLFHYILTYHISKLMPEIRCWFDHIYRNWKK